MKSLSSAVEGECSLPLLCSLRTRELKLLVEDLRLSRLVLGLLLLYPNIRNRRIRLSLRRAPGIAHSLPQGRELPFRTLGASDTASAGAARAITNNVIRIFTTCDNPATESRFGANTK